MSLQEQVDMVVSVRDKERAALTALQEKMQEASVPSAEQQERIDQLERHLEDKQRKVESLEMQLLDLERERDTVGGLRGSGGMTT